MTFPSVDAAVQALIDPLNANLAALTSELAQANAALAAAKAQDGTDVTTLTAEIASRDATIAQLEAELAALQTPPPPPPPPSKSKTVFGFNISPGSSYTQGAKETAGQQIARAGIDYAPLAVGKYFGYGAGSACPTAFNVNGEGLVPGKQVFVCLELDPNQIVAGAYDAAITSYAKSVPAGWRVMLVNWQEPDDEIWVKSQFTLDAHRNAGDHLFDLIHSLTLTGKVELWDCWMEYSILSGRWNDAAVSAKRDGILWDFYLNDNGATADPSKRIAAMRAVNNRAGVKKIGIGEMGDRRPWAGDSDGSKRGAYWDLVYGDLVKAGFDYVIYFNAVGTTGDHRIRTDQTIDGPMWRAVKKYCTS